MKKIIIILLLAVSIFSTACSQNENKDTPNKNESSQEEKELIFTEEKSDIVDGSHMYELFDKLASYGREIYKNEEYSAEIEIKNYADLTVSGTGTVFKEKSLDSTI